MQGEGIKMSEKRIRMNMRIPESTIKKFEQYQEEEEGIATKTSTIE